VLCYALLHNALGTHYSFVISQDSGGHYARKSRVNAAFLIVALALQRSKWILNPHSLYIIDGLVDPPCTHDDCFDSYFLLQRKRGHLKRPDP
jgi:hypothetical protein